MRGKSRGRSEGQAVQTPEAGPAADRVLRSDNLAPGYSDLK